MKLRYDLPNLSSADKNSAGKQPGDCGSFLQTVALISMFILRLLTVDGVTDPCANNDCEYGARCVPSVEGSTHYCHCPQTKSECREWFGFGDSDLDSALCGSDGNDYENLCMLRMYTCTTFTDVSVAKLGKCSEFWIDYYGDIIGYGLFVM